MNKKLLSVALVGAFALAPNVMASAEEVTTSTNEEIVISTADSETLSAPTQSATMELKTDNIVVLNEDDSNGSTKYELYNMTEGADGTVGTPVAVYASDKSGSIYESYIATETEYFAYVDQTQGLGQFVDFTGYEVTISTGFTIVSNGELVDMPSTFNLYMPSIVDHINHGSDFAGGSLYLQAAPGAPIYEVDGSSYTPSEVGNDFVLPAIIDGVEGTITFTKEGNGGDIIDDTIKFTPATLVDPEYGIDGIDSDGDGLTDSEEANLGTKSDNPDTDGDGFTDLEEVEMMTNPLDKADFPVISEEVDTDEEVETNEEVDTDDKLAYTGNGAPVGLLAALGSALFIFKRRG